MKKISILSGAAVWLFACSCSTSNTSENENKPASIIEETVSYKADTAALNGFVAYKDSGGLRLPVVLIVHEWWGLNDYPRSRAKQLAGLGYFAMAVDIYGNGKTVDNPTDAGEMARPFYVNPQLAKARFDAALEKVKTFAAADTTQIAAIGYCFGGGLLLTVSRMGEPLKGIVAFHGSMPTVPAEKDRFPGAVLVCHGDDDKFVSLDDVSRFSHEMDSIGADYTVKHYAGATHAFSNPAATSNGEKYDIPIAYNAAADSASFSDMLTFFDKIFK